ncbi:MAG: hypothetical protein H6696_20705 [Deferribacteres bacterium]|nr:hypothetical protein [candidate division KSB1 bacterium]MCB9504353.1 hypothetical protein [Deferribacteres bacterium]
MFTFLLWCVLFILCWPLALVALILYPIVWIVLLPFRLIGFTVSALFEFLKELIMLPANIIKKLAH